MLEVNRAETAVIDDELEEARAMIQAVFERMECMEGRPNPALITGLWQVSGAIRYFQGSSELARLDLARGKSIPGAVFRERLGADLRKVWSELIVDFNAQLDVRPLPPGHLLVVDGAARRSNSILLPAGWHLIQVFRGEERVLHRAMHIHSGQRAEIETGLDAPILEDLSGLGNRKTFFWGGVLGGVAAVGSYGLALSYDGRMRSSKSAVELYEYREVSQNYAAAAVGFALLSVSSFGVHLSF